MDNKGKGLVGKIVGLWKKETPKMESIIEEYNLEKLIEDVCNEVNPSASQKNLPVLVEIAENLPRLLSGEANIISYILKCLLFEAIKNTETGYIKLIINGNTFDNNVKLHFELKYTGEGTMDTSKGDVCHVCAILEDRGCNLTVNDNNQWCEVAFEVEQNIAVKQENKSNWTDNTLDILVIDDNEINVCIMKSLLKDFRMNIHSCYSGNEALRMLEEMKYDMVFLDHMMPELDGIETLKIHRKNESSINKNTPIIVLTANAESGAKEEYEKEGFTGYLAKPVVKEELIRIIDENYR